MNILVIGSGGREHALVWKIAQERNVKRVYCAPGNGGISQQAELLNISVADVDRLVAAATQHKIDLVVVGPESALAAGLVDALGRQGIAAFGPTQAAARIETSKVFSKELMQRCGVPTPAFAVFDRADAAREHIKQTQGPVVVKADGLCGGKGAIVASNQSEAMGAVGLMMEDRIFGAAADRILVEEAIAGEEVSLFVITDGTHAIPLAPSQDHKRINDGDQGPNTGGMGAYSPTPVMTDELLQRVMHETIHPVLRGLREEGLTYRGVLYAGLMLTSTGPQVLEFNARLGDPEVQATLPRLRSPLVPLMLAASQGTIGEHALAWDRRHCACVVMVSGGYPGEYVKGHPISGLEAASAEADVLVFHAGTRRSNGGYVTDGGRVLNVVGLDADLDGALKTAYAAVQRIQFENCHYRKDIGWRACRRPVTK